MFGAGECRCAIENGVFAGALSRVWIADLLGTAVRFVRFGG